MAVSAERGIPWGERIRQAHLVTLFRGKLQFPFALYGVSFAYLRDNRHHRGNKNKCSAAGLSTPWRWSIARAIHTKREIYMKRSSAYASSSIALSSHITRIASANQTHRIHKPVDQPVKSPFATIQENIRSSTQRG